MEINLKNSRKLHAACILLIALIGIALYASVGGHGYSYYDDGGYIVLNDRVLTGLTLDNILWAFTEHQYMNNWHPLTWVSYMADISLFGASPGAQHWVNVVFHLLNSILLYSVVIQFVNKPLVAFLVAVVFLIHPVHVESVAWIAERKDVLSGFFFLLTLLYYLKKAKSLTVLNHIVLSLCFALALMAKPMVVTLPVVLLLLDFWPLGRVSLQDIKDSYNLKRIQPNLRTVLVEKWFLFLLSFVCGLITIVAQSSSINTLESLTLIYRIFNAVVSYAAYLKDLILPTNLAFYHPIKAIGFFDVFLPSITALAVITFFALKRYKKNPELLFGWLWFLITLLPVIGLLQVASQARADRYLYLPSIGIFIAVAVCVSRWSYPAIKKFMLVACPVLILYFFLASIQVSYWGNPIALYLQALENGGDSYTTRLNLASAYLDANLPNDAKIHIIRAIEIDPENPYGYQFLGRVYSQKGEFEQAEMQLRQSLKLDPTLALSWNNLGAALWSLGKKEEALTCFRRAFELRPTLSIAKKNLNVLSQEMEDDL